MRGLSLLALRTQVLQATNPTEKQVCHELVEKVYTKKGYTFSKNFQPADVFYVAVEGIITATISIVPDSLSDGLPLDKIYKEEARELRNRYGTIGEVIEFAVDDDNPKASGLRTLVLPLFREILYCARTKKINVLGITVNPIDTRFYSLLGFQGDCTVEKTHPGVGAPAVFLSVVVKQWLADRQVT